MNLNSLPLLCFWDWDGRTFHGSQGTTFDDATPMAVIEINRGLKHSELIDQIYDLIGSDCDKNKLKITCGYIANGSHEYVVFPVLNDKSVDIMVDKTEEKGVNRIEIHIKKIHEVVGSHTDVCLYEPDDVGAGDPSYVHFLVHLTDGKYKMCRMKLETPVQKLVTAFSDSGYKDIRFIYQTRQLQEHKTLKEYNISDYSTITALGRLRGD